MYTISNTATMSLSLIPNLVSPTPSTGSEGSRASDTIITTPVKDLSTPTDELVPTEAILDVECGPNKGVLYLSKLCQGSKGSCILFNGSWLTPNEFQYVSGRETAKDWKRSIRHYGKSMKLLLTKSIMTVQPPVCKCEGCRPDLVNEIREGDLRSTTPPFIQSPSFLIKPKSPTTPQDSRKSVNNNGLLSNSGKKVKVVVKTTTTTANQKLPFQRMAETNSEKVTPLLHDNNNSEILKDSELNQDSASQSLDASPRDGATSPPRESRLNNIIEGLKNAAKPKEGDTIQGTPLTNGHMDNSQNGISESNDNEGGSVDVMTRAASCAALSPSNSSSASPLAASAAAVSASAASAAASLSAAAAGSSSSSSSLAAASSSLTAATSTATSLTAATTTSSLTTSLSCPTTSTSTTGTGLNSSNNNNNDVVNLSTSRSNTPHSHGTVDRLSDSASCTETNNRSVSSSPTGSTVAPPASATSDPSGLAPGILRNMLKIPMDGTNSDTAAEGTPVVAVNANPHSPNGSNNSSSSATSNHNNNNPASLPTNLSQVGGVSLPASDRNDRTSPRISTKSPVDLATQQHHRTPEPKLWSPHDASYHFSSSSEKSATTPDKKNNELNGHYGIEHKPYMSASMTPPALKPITKDQERSPKRHEGSSSKSESDRKKDMPVFRMPEAEAVQPKVYAPVTWPPVAPDAAQRKEESSPRRPLSSNSDKPKSQEVSKLSSASSSHKSPSSSSSSSSSESKSGHHGSSSSSKMSTSATVTSSSATALSQEAMTAQYHDYLRQPGLYPNLAQPRMDSAEYLAFLRKYYEWYELQQRLYAAYPMTAATTGSMNPYASFMPGMMDPRLRQEVPKQTAPVAGAHMSPFIYGIDPRAIPGAVPIDWSKCGLTRPDLKAQNPGRPSSSESPSKPSTSASAHSSPHAAAKQQEVNGKRTHAESEAEALDLSVKRRRMEESRAAAEKETMHRDMMSAFGRVAQPTLSNGLHAAAAAGTPGMPMAYPMYPGMWDLAALQPGAMPGVSIPGLTANNPYAAASLSKDHVDPAVTTHIPFTLPHLTPPCTSLAERERLMSHFRL